MKEEHLRKTSKKKWGLIAVPVVLLILALCAFLALREVKTVKAEAGQVKTDVKQLAESMLAMDMDASESADLQLDADVSGLRTRLDGLLWRLAYKVKPFAAELDSVDVLLDTAETASDSLVKPAISTLREYPLSDMENGGFNKGAIGPLLELYEDMLPVLSKMADDLGGVKLKYADTEGKIAGYIDIFITAERFIESASADVLVPVADYVINNPLTDIKTEEGLDISAAVGYLGMLDEYLPELIPVIKQVKADYFPEDEGKGALLNQVIAVCEFAEESLNKVYPLFLEQYNKYPISSMEDIKDDRGINVGLIGKYLEFLPQIMPDAEQIIYDFAQLDMSLIDKDGKIQKYIDKANELIGEYHRAEEYLPLISMLLGDGEDRIYLLAAQNSAEIRACGGFPGSMGVIEIKDGYFSFGEFKSCYDYLAFTGSKEINIEAKSLFSERIERPWDSTMSPDFQLAAEIMTDGFETLNGYEINGVISMTPVIIQDLLEIYGGMELSDGNYIDGTNAARFIMHDLYEQYFPPDAYTSKANKAADKIFSEIASYTMKKVCGDLSVSKICGLLDVFKERTGDRTILFWMKDTEEESLIEQYGCSGKMNDDPENPVLGVFFSGLNSSKLGYYIDLETEIGEPAKNEDGSCTYPVTVTATHTADPEEISSKHVYVQGRYYNGVCYAYYLFFAPAGGTLSYVREADDYVIETRSIQRYKNLQCTAIGAYLWPGTSAVFTFTVTTAPGVDTPLKLETTPTLTEYR